MTILGIENDGVHIHILDLYDLLIDDKVVSKMVRKLKLKYLW